MCTGYGSQYPQMGRELYESEPVYREAFDRCDAIAAPLLGRSLSALLYGRQPATTIDDPVLAQPALFAVGYALHALWQSWGVRADVMAGHSLGEYLAAHLAGIFSAEDALALVIRRAQLVEELAPTATMAYIATDVDTVTAALSGYGQTVAIAAVNAPDATVISGETSAVEALLAELRERGIDAVMLPVTRAFHSPLMKPVLDAFRAVAESITYAAPRIPLVANLSGELAGPADLASADYWVRHLLEPVQFTHTMAMLACQNLDAFVELGPKPTLTGLGQRCLPDSGAVWVPSMTPRDSHAALAGARSLYLAGIRLDWNGIGAPFARGRVPVPTYAFQRRRHWLEVNPSRPPVDPAAFATAADQVPPPMPQVLDLVWEPALHGTEHDSACGYVVIGDDNELSTAIIERLDRDGTGGVFVPTSPAAPGALAERLRRLPSIALPWRLVVVVSPLDPADAAAGLVALLDHLGEVLAFATTGAHAVAGVCLVSGENDLRGEAVAAVARTLAAEHPDLGWSALTIPTPCQGSDLDAAITALHTGGRGEHFMVCGGALFCSRLVPSAEHPAPRAAMPVREDGIYVITGGTGGLGLQVACWLARQRPARLILVSRYGIPADESLWKALAATGVPVEVATADVTDETQLRAIVEACGSRLRGVVHCAGGVDDAILLRHNRTRFARVVEPKAAGAWLLHTLTADAGLDFFVMFSSLASVIGYRGQGAYAAANGFLDALARHRHRQGLPALSVSWGSWAGPGMSAALSPVHRATLHGEGETPLAPQSALAAMAALVHTGQPHAVVADMTWPQLSGARSHPLPIIEALVTPAPTSRTTPADSFALRVRKAPPAQAKSLLASTVAEIAATLLDADPHTMDPRRGFAEMGLDSLAALDLRTALQTRLGVGLPATVAFDHPCLEALVDHFATHHFASDIAAAATEATAPSSSAGAQPPQQSAAAIIGLACKFPGAESPQQFWELISQGRDMVAEIPSSRWDLNALFDPDPAVPGKMHVRRAATITDLDCFDAGFFGISPREAASMDPRHRLLLELAWNAVEHAGIDPTSLRGSDTAVFLGCDEFANDYLRQAESELDREPYLATGTTLSLTAGRISYKLGCHGPSMVIATGCSSALVAIHTAVAALRRGECRVAIVGSGKLLLDPIETVQLCKLGALAPDGVSKVFSAEADGFGRGEGAAVIVLKRLDHARIDGDPIHAVIRGSAVNHDGPSSGLTVPNGAAQQAVITRALADAGVDAEQVSYVETHGTGTALGDPIEVNALGQVFARRRDPVLIGSVKANIGHLEEAAGLAGLIKTVLALQHDTIPAQPHARPLNDHIDWTRLPVSVPAASTPWPPARPRVAGVSSIGLSGTNAHLIVEAAPAFESSPPAGPFVFPISARDETDLRATLTALHGALAEETSAAELAWTLQSGRQHHDHRLAVVTTEVSVLRERLSAVLRNAATAASVLRGDATAAAAVQDTVTTVMYERRDMVGLARLWCAGTAIDWTRLSPEPPRRTSLPGYPFKRQRLWIGTHTDTTSATEHAVAQSDTPSTDLVTELRARVAEMLGFAVGDLAPDTSLDGAGADSLIFTRLAHHIRDHYQIEVPFQQLIDDADTVEAIAALIAAHHRPHIPPAPTAPTQPPPPSKAVRGPASPTGAPAPAQPLTDRQQRFVAELADSYVARTPASKARAVQERSVMANCRMTPFQMPLKEMAYPIAVERSFGPRFWDIDGNEYLDISMGYGVHFFGYQPDFVIEALRAQLDQGVHIGPLAANAGPVAAQLCELTGAERAVFCNSGTEAVTAALRFARAATGRTRFVMFSGSYHGWSDATLALPAGTEKSLPIARGLSSAALSEVIVLDYGTPEALQVIADLGPQLAAVLVEPVQSRRPDLQPVEFLHQLRALTRDSGTALIFDEVVTGFRAGPRGAQGWSGVEADLAVYGKILGGGMPVGAVAGRARFLDTVDGGDWRFGDSSQPRVPTTFFGGTFNKNPMTMAAASAVLARLSIEGPQLQQRVSDQVNGLAEQFNRFCQAEGFPLRIVSFASVFRFIGADGDYRLHRSTLALEVFFHTLAAHGIYVLETRVCFLSASHTPDDVAHLLETAKTCLRQMRRGGFFPLPAAPTSTPPLVPTSNRPARLLEDARLEPIITPAAAVRRARPADNIVITGAAGFLGTHLTAELLGTTSARVHCLVRADDAGHAQQRVITALTAAQLYQDTWASRIIGVPADLARPRLGLTPNRWAQLAEESDAIYHCGAQVNSLLSYEKLKPANVNGTRELIRLAADGPLSQLHHISSDAVFDAYGYLRNAVLYEDRPLVHGESLFGGGYAETKWVAEKLVEQARSHGLPTNIYRPGAIMGAHARGCGQPNDFITRFLRGIITLGVCPEMDATIDIAPVDYVAAAIVDLSHATEPGTTFHLTHPAPLRYDEFIDVLRADGYRLEVIALHDWEVLLAGLRFADDNPLYPLIPLLTGSDPYFRTSRLDVTNTTTHRPGVSCPPLLELIPLYLDRLRTHDYLPPRPVRDQAGAR
ncbi:type I polyketide synthase [Nocardia suismassiliense]|uniref:type I polyketide synthase n=1 Tax=Nocardia suismassiliense TaxID=2077092 RepID=UPI00227764B1|nr:type I polyketide synthase [Nocardia suismassiliense]